MLDGLEVYRRIAMVQEKQIFISYAKDNADIANQLAEDLRQPDVNVWIASRSISPGESWVSAINRGLEESSHVVVVLTQSAMKSKSVEKEIEVAISMERQNQIQFIPLVLKDCRVPPILGTYQWVSFKNNYEAGIAELSKRLEIGKDSVQIETLPKKQNKFVMTIEDVFSITGRGTVVVGCVEHGKIEVGDSVKIIVKQGRELSTVVTGIEMFQKTLRSAVVGDNVGLLLRGIEKSDVARGMVIYKP